MMRIAPIASVRSQGSQANGIVAEPAGLVEEMLAADESYNPNLDCTDINVQKTPNKCEKAVASKPNGKYCCYEKKMEGGTGKCVQIGTLIEQIGWHPHLADLCNIPGMEQQFRSMGVPRY